MSSNTSVNRKVPEYVAIHCEGGGVRLSGNSVWRGGTRIRSNPVWSWWCQCN